MRYEEHVELERHRLGLPYVAFIGGKVEGARECVMEVMIARPLHAPPTGKVVVDPVRARAIIDTGATDSSVRFDLAARIGLPVVDQRIVSSATSGEDDVICPVVLADLYVRDIRGQQLRLFAQELIASEMSDDMLLGMDLLSGGVLTVDMLYGTWNWKYYAPAAVPDGDSSRVLGAGDPPVPPHGA